MIIFSDKHSKEQVISLLGQWVATFLYPGLDRQATEQIHAHLAMMTLDQQQLHVSCTFQAFENGTVAMQTEFAWAKPVVDSGKRIEQ